MNKIFAAFQVVVTIFVLIFGGLTGHLKHNIANYYSKDEIQAFSCASKNAGKNGLIIAIGGGFDTYERFKPLIEKCIAHTCRKNPNFLFVPTANLDLLHEHEEIIQWFEKAGCNSDILLVSKASEKEIKEKIEKADIIYETGGNLRFLTENWKTKGVFDEVTKAFSRGAALIGPSSGAMCWAAKGWDDCGEDVFRIIDSFPFLGMDSSYDFYDCAGIIPFCICPHFDNIAWRTYAFEALKTDIPSLCIENGAAVVYCDGKYKVVSDASTPWKTAYLIHPKRKIVMMDMRKNNDFLCVADGEMR